MSPHLKSDYFNNQEKIAFTLIDGYVQKYNARPSVSSLLVEFQDSPLANEENYNSTCEIIKSLQDVPKEDNDEWLVEKTERFCRDAAVSNAIMESLTIIEGKDKTRDQGAIPKILQDAIGTTFNTNVGHDYLEQAEERFDFYHNTETKVPFDIDVFNEVTKEGVARKTLNVFMAPPHAGKSLVMCHLAAADLTMGRNVVYITMEMAEERIAERIDANLMNVEMDQMMNMSKDAFTTKANKIKGKTQGKLIVKEFPTGAAHAGHFRALFNELKLKKNFKPDVVYIDYLNICASSRMRLGGAINTYSLVKSIAEELRGLAVEFNIPIWTATQVNREGTKSSDFGMTDTSESFGLPATADLFWAIIITDELKAMGQLMIKQLKNRYRDMNYKEKFVIGIDRAKMRLYDLEDNQAGLIPDSSSDYSPVETPFNNKTPLTSFNDFKM